jgi:hypothetical protein
MADKGRRKNRSHSQPLTVTLPAETIEYFVLLATLGKIGATENEVAAHLLVSEYRRLERDGYHERRLPKPAAS